MGTLVTKEMRTASVAAPAAVAKPASKPRHMPYGDAARVLGTIAVVIGHCCDMIVFSPQATMQDWWICNLADAASRWAVPVYVMLSGALLLDPHRSEAPREFYGKRLARLGVPIVFWSAAYMWLSVNYTGWSTSEQAWRNLAFGQPYAHLHFVFRIAGLYAFTPMLRVFLKHADEKLVALTVVLLLGLSTANSIMTNWTGGELSMFLRFAPFMGFYLLGYLLRERKISKRALLGCWMMAISCILLLAGGTGLLVEIYPRTYPSQAYALYDFLSPVRITLAVCAWLIVVNTFDETWFNSPLGKFNTKWLAPATLGIYLIHLVFREVLFMNGFNAIWPNVWIGIPLNAAMVYIPSVIAVLIIMRIPVLKRIVI